MYKFKIVKNHADMRTMREFAPNKQAIYNIWLGKLQPKGKSDTGYKLERNDYVGIVDRGTPRGGAFEKQLDRYRRKFMAQLWAKFNNWGKE